MGEFDWLGFLRKWNDKVFAADENKEIPEELRERGWLGYPGAREEAILEAEGHLGIALPPSYKAFLKVSNGWNWLNMPTMDLVWGVERIDWFREENLDWIETWSDTSAHGEFEPTPDDEYFSYDEPDGDFRTEHLRDALQISDVEDGGVLLLNPQVISKDGEWEAWFMANWIPGVSRHRSFQEMMEETYASFAGVEWRRAKGVMEDLPDQYEGSPGSAGRRLIKPTFSSEGPGVEALLAALEDRELAFKLFPKARDVGEYGERQGMTPEGEARRRVVYALWKLREVAAVPSLIRVLKIDDDWAVRRAVLAALGHIGGEEAVEALTLAMNEEYGGVMAMEALSRLAPERVIEPALRVLERANIYEFRVAGGILARLGEVGALSILVRMAEDPDSPWELGQGAINCIWEFGVRGLDILKRLMGNKNPMVRWWAGKWLKEMKGKEVREVWESLLNNGDPKLREIAAEGLADLRRREGSAD